MEEWISHRCPSLVINSMVRLPSKVTNCNDVYMWKMEGRLPHWYCSSSTERRPKISSLENWKQPGDVLVHQQWQPKLGRPFSIWIDQGDLGCSKKNYSRVDNTSELFAMKSALHELWQGDLSVTQYFNLLTRNWQQLNVFEEHKWNCPEDGLRYRRIVERRKLYKFLFGLNKELDGMRERILGLKTLPSVHEAFFEVRMEERRRKFMLGDLNSLQNRWIRQGETKQKKREDLGVIIFENQGNLLETPWGNQ